MGGARCAKIAQTRRATLKTNSSRRIVFETLFFLPINRTVSLLRGEGRSWKLSTFCVRWNREIDFIASVLAFYKFVAWKCSGNVYGNMCRTCGNAAIRAIAAFPQVRHMFMGTPFPHKNIHGNGVPMRSRSPTPLLSNNYGWNTKKKHKPNWQ